MKLCTSKYSIESLQKHSKNDPEFGKSDLTNSGNLVKENHVQNAPRIAFVFIVSVLVFFVVFVVFQGKL